MKLMAFYSSIDDKTKLFGNLYVYNTRKKVNKVNLWHNGLTKICNRSILCWALKVP